MLAGLGLGLFVASALEELGVYRTAWVGFLAIVLLGMGQVIALGAVRRSWQSQKGIGLEFPIRKEASENSEGLI